MLTDKMFTVFVLRYRWKNSPLRFLEIFFLFHSCLKNGLLAIWKCVVIGNIRVTKTQKTCFALFSASVTTIALHEWSLYDFYSSCNSFFSRLIFDVYTSCDGLASNTVNILRVVFFRASQKQRKIRAMRKCTSCVTSFFFCHFLSTVNANKKEYR